MQGDQLKKTKSSFVLTSTHHFVNKSVNLRCGVSDPHESAQCWERRRTLLFTVAPLGALKSTKTIFYIPLYVYSYSEYS